jgi:RNA recognition motif-containing protein
MGKRLYVGNLDYSTTEANLSELFGEVGEIVSVNLVTDRVTGRSKGFAFVEMAQSSDAKTAIEQLNGKILGERTIKVDEARPRRERGSSGDYGGYGGGGRGGRGGRRY